MTHPISTRWFFLRALSALVSVLVLASGTVALAAAPSLESMSPSAAKAGGPSFTLVLLGSHFDATSIVRWNGSPRDTTFISTTELQASISSSDISEAGTASVEVFNPALTGGTSETLTFRITADEVPTITSLMPSSARAGSAAITLTVLGTNFNSSSKVYWNDAALVTSLFSASTLEATVPSLDLATPGSVRITVVNTSPATAVSNTVRFPVLTNAAVPTITKLSPSIVLVKGPSFTLTVTGTNFSNSTVVRWNGSERPTTLVDSTTLTAAIPATDIAKPGTVTITVLDTAPGGGVSAGFSLPVTAFLTAFFPQVAVGGGYTTTITLYNSLKVAISGNLVLTDQSGAPFLVNGTEPSADERAPSAGDGFELLASTFPLAIPASGSRTLTFAAPAASDPTKSGAARFESTEGTVSGVAVFQLRSGGALKTSAGVLAATPVETATILVDNSAAQSRFTGFSILNPTDENVSIRIVTVDENGSTLDTLTPAELNPLGPRKQVTRFLHEYVNRTTFRGSMVLTSQGGKLFVPVALTVQENVLTTIPVVK
jgi:hypothetical protein